MIQTDIPLILEREFGLPEHESAVAVGFGMMPIEDKKETLRLGRPFYKDVEFVKIETPGDTKSIYLQPATDRDRKRFPKAYAAFKSGEIVAHDGTPLEQWPMIGRSQALNFKLRGVHTVEALAGLHEGNVENFGRETRELREKARAYLKQAEDTAAVQKLASEKQSMESRMAAMEAQMQAQIADLTKRLGEATAAAPKKGRPTAAAE